MIVELNLGKVLVKFGGLPSCPNDYLSAEYMSGRRRLEFFTMSDISGRA